MKALVLKSYVDRTTRINHKKNEVVEVTPERFEEINSTSHGIILESKEETVPDAAPDAAIDYAPNAATDAMSDDSDSQASLVELESNNDSDIKVTAPRKKSDK